MSILLHQTVYLMLIYLDIFKYFAFAKKTFIFPLQMKIHLISVELELESITCDYKKLSKKICKQCSRGL